MKVSELIDFLENFDGDKEVSILVHLPDFEDWDISECSFAVSMDEDSGEPVLRTAVYMSDFDYPEILSELRDLVEAIPEYAFAPR